MKQTDNEKQVLFSLNSFLYDLHYSLATEAAYRGDYSLASDYVVELIKQFGEKPNLLDLNAKINAQQGNFKQAEFLWQKCIKIDPENRSYPAALVRLQKIQRIKASSNINKLGLIGGIAGLSLLFILLLNSSRRNRDIQGALSKLNKQQNDIFIYLNEQKALQQEVVEDSLLSRIAHHLSEIEDINILQIPSEIIIHFKKGLFNKADRLLPTQKSVISSLARVLESYSDKISAYILGYTDDIPITDSSNFKSNNALSIARASKVYDIFYSESRFLIKNLKIESGSEKDTPFPNDTEENKRKNRTVVIKLFQIENK